MKRVLITGGCGFVGKSIIEKCLDEFELNILDNFTSGKDRAQTIENIEKENLSIYNVDIRNSNQVKEIVKKIEPDIIIHLAAVHYIPECENNPQNAVATNVTGTVNLLSAAPKNCRFIFTSSGAVYKPKTKPLTENTAVEPVDIYGYTKHQGEKYVEYLSHKIGFQSVIVRLFNVIGPGETNPHILPEIMAQLKAGRRKLQLGNITSRRDYIDVEDVADGFLKLASIEGFENNTIVNLASGSTNSVEELLEEIRKTSRIDFDIVIDDSRIRKNDRPILCADIQRLEELTSWHPQKTLSETIERTWHEPQLPASIIEKYKV